MRFMSAPESAFQPCPQGGTLHRFTYAAHLDDGTPVEKAATVYLPRGYEPPMRYPVLYLMHGGGGDETEWFRAVDGCEGLKNLLDHAIACGNAPAMIVVTPTYLLPADPSVHRDPAAAVALTHRFPRELANDLIPAIDAAYSTLQDRRYRAFGGFSMGAETTWSVLADAARDVGTVLPLSGDYWAVCLKGGKDHPAETVDALLQRMENAGSSIADCRILAATGDQDIAYEAMDALVRELSSRPGVTLGELPDSGNLTWLCKPGGVHWYQEGWHYLWQLLPWVFPDSRCCRVALMERILDDCRAAADELQAALARWEAAQTRLAALEAYYTCPQWLGDFDADAQGMLPPTMKRGVLTEDAVWDLLTDAQNLRRQMAELGQAEESHDENDE